MTNRHEPDPYAPNHELRAEDLKFKAEGARRHRDYIVPDNAVEPALVIAPTRRRHSKKKMKTGMKILLIVLACLLGIVAVAGATILFLQSRGRHTMLPQTPVTIVVPESVETDPQVEIEVTDDGRTVTYNGERYRFNENRTNILCIGVDQNDPLFRYHGSLSDFDIETLNQFLDPLPERGRIGQCRMTITI